MAFRFNGLLQKRFPSCISGGWKRYAPADAGYYYYFFFFMEQLDMGDSIRLP